MRNSPSPPKKRSSPTRSEDNTSESDNVRTSQPVTRAHKLITAVVLAVMIATMAAMSARSGIRMGGDSPLYLDGAQDLVEGDSLEGIEIAYAGYIAFLAGVQAIGLGLGAIVFLQVVAASMAGVALYAVVAGHLNRVVGVIAAGLLLLNPDITRWHAYILTDSLYVSAVVFSVWAIANANAKRGMWLWFAPIVVVLSSTIRPSGWILIPAVISFWVASKTAKWFHQLAALILTFVIFSAVVGASPLRERLESAAPGEKLSTGVVIPGYQPSWISMPEDPQGSGSDLGAAFGYVGRHPIATARLALVRIGVELAGVRPYYSPKHNLVVGVLLALIYLTAIRGLGVLRKTRLNLLLGIVIGAHLAFIALSFATYDGRFLIYVLPLIGIYSAAGAGSMWKRLRASSYL